MKNTHSVVGIVKTKPASVISDYPRLMDLANYQKFVPTENETILKLNLSWSRYYPACSTEPWQLEGVVKKLKADGYSKIHSVENRTVVTDAWKGAKGNLWRPIIKKYNLKYTPLTETKWIRHKPKATTLAHPGTRIRKNCLRIEDIKSLDFDAIEAYNARNVFSFENEKAPCLAKSLRLPGIVGSDAHFTYEVGKNAVEAYELYTAIKRARLSFMQKILCLM